MKLKGLKQFGKELSGIGRNKMLLISVVGILLIPVMYSSMFIGAFWDPYSNLNKMPVAIVNEDKGFEYNDEVLHMGRDFEDALKENGTFNWKFVSKEEALAGMKDHSYYMAIEIPADFSEKTTTLTSDKPMPAKLDYLTNESYNFLAAQIGNKAVDQMKVELNKEVTAAYTRTVFKQMEKLVDGIGEAGKGAGEIADGTTKVKDGAVLIEQNLKKLVSGSLALQEGVEKLDKGGQKLSAGNAELSAGAASLADGLLQLNNAQEQLGAGAVTLGESAATLGAGAVNLSNGLAQLAGASDQLADSASSAQQASGQVADGLTASVSSTKKLENGASEIVKGLEQLAKSDAQLANNESLAALIAASKELEAGLTKSAASQSQLSGGAKQLNEGLAKITTGLGTFDEKVQQAAAGGEQLGAGGEQVSAGALQFSEGMTQFGVKLTEASAGANQLSSGSAELNEGAKELATGLGELSRSVVPFIDGTSQLEGGAEQVSSGLMKLHDGTHELSSKLTNATEQTSDLELSDAAVDMFADPIQVELEKITEVNNYGTGLAPYFLSLALFVGAMLLTIVYSVREPAIRPANGWSWFLGKALTLALIGTVQALIADVVLIYVLNLEVQSIALFVTFSILTSIMFMMIVQFLVATMGNPGRFIAIILLIFQLTSSAGTFPIELIPSYLQKISPFLPMTYAVAAFRDIVSSGDFSSMWGYAATLLAYAAAFAALSLAYFTYSYHKDKKQTDVKRAEAVLN